MRKFMAILAGCTLCLASCQPKGDKFATTIDGFAQGTYYHIVCLSRDTLHLEGPIDSLFTVIDNSMSIFNPSSLLSRLNRNETDSLDPYITHCIETAAKVSRLTDGTYDITVKPLVEAWGFAASEQEEDPNLDSLLQFVGYERISIRNGRLVKEDPRMQIDLNSIAKGYATDLIAKLIESYGVKEYLVELGGEIVMRGHNPSGKVWTVGIDKPVEGNYTPGAQTQTIISVTDKAIATSGNYRNYRYDAQGRRIVHTINPKTGASTPSDLLSATVVADDCATADALGTAMMALGVEGAKRLLEKNPGVWGYLIYADQKGEFQTYVSPELQKRIVQ